MDEIPKPGSILPPGKTPSDYKQTKPLFETLATTTFDKCKATFRERGDQYGDTWRDCQWLKLKAILFTMFGMKPTLAQCRAMALASMGDMKYQRLQGGYAEDHLIDGINYDAALVSEMKGIYASPAQTYKCTTGEFTKVPCPSCEPVRVRVNGEWKDL